MDQGRQEFLTMRDQRKVTCMLDQNQLLPGRFDDVKVCNSY